MSAMLAIDRCAGSVDHDRAFPSETLPASYLAVPVWRLVAKTLHVHSSILGGLHQNVVNDSCLS